jgi:hypothetical protein
MDDSAIAGDPTRFLRAPWIKQWTFEIRRGRYQIHVYDQPGRWMSDGSLSRLVARLVDIGARSMDELPTYGVFTSARASFSNRVVGVMVESGTAEPVAFTAMVYLPIELGGTVEPVLHLGLTMIKKSHRGQRLQGPLLERMFFLPAANQLRVRWITTSIAASPAGIGSVSDYLDDVYPAYRGEVKRRGYHLEVAQKLLARYRHEFGCAPRAVFDPETFVVKGSNDRDTGGAYQFICVDPVSRHKDEVCNRFCAQRLRFHRGDELFQVARLDLVRGVYEILGRRSTRRRDAAEAKGRSEPAFSP